VAVTIKKGRDTPGGFDPSVKKGWRTHLVRIDNQRRYEVVKYDQKTMVATLVSPNGAKFTTTLTDGTQHHYSVEMTRK